MDKFCKKCGNILKSSIEIDGVIFDISKRNFCLSCYKFVEKKKAGDNSEKKTFQDEKFCPKCKNVKPVEEFRKFKYRREADCKNCSAIAQYNKIILFKEKIIAYKGGACEKCGYDKCLGALDFHHRDPNEKDFNLGEGRYKKEEDLKAEVDKCDLLCSNCHRELHAEIGRIKIEQLKEENKKNDRPKGSD